MGQIIGRSCVWRQDDEEDVNQWLITDGEMESNLSYDPLTRQEVENEETDDGEVEEEEKFLNPKVENDMEGDIFQFTEILAHQQKKENLNSKSNGLMERKHGNL